MAELDLRALRAFRESSEGRARREALPTPRLCDPFKNAQFTRRSPLGRPQHSM